MNTGLVLNLDFENSDTTNIFDTSRYHNNGVITGTTRQEKGYRFNGTSDKVVVTTAAQLQIVVSRITIMAWVKTATTAEQAIIDKENDGDTPTAGYALRVSTTGNAEFTTNNDKYSSGVSVVDNVPHFICGVLDGTNKFIVVDDKLAVTKAYTTAITDSALNLGVGSQQKATNEIYYNGIIYFGKVYNKALTLTQIIDIYNSTKYRYK